MSNPPSLAVTMGDPAGIGPLVTVAALEELQDLCETHRVIVIGHQPSLIEAARRLGLEWTWGKFDIIEPLPHFTTCEPGVPTQEGGRLQVKSIDAACTLAREGRVQAIVTGPVSKISITKAGEQFTGHTEHIARAAGIEPDQVTMMFAGPKLKVALVTTHLPLMGVSEAITSDRVVGTLGRVITALRQWWHIERPRIVVLGLNPHAGEDGLFGLEEEQVIAPAIERVRRQQEEAIIAGPIPSEAGLRRTLSGDFDCAIAHYHDQATIASKLVEMGQAVNVTLGLPYLRTSVDHGVAYDAAISGDVDPGSMIAALRLAAQATSSVREKSDRDSERT